MALSVDVIKYLQEKKEMTVDDIAKAMSTTSEHIQDVIINKRSLGKDNLKSYLENTDEKFWKMACDGDLLKHLPEDLKSKVLLCKEIDDSISKNKKK
jgi:plasmid maintenance system antidote protein VapI